MKKETLIKRYSGKSANEIMSVVLEVGGDPDLKEFDKSLVDKVDKVFGLIDQSAKQLPPDLTGDLVLSEGVSIASRMLASEGISISSEMLVYLMRPVIKEALAVALAVREVGREVFNRVLESGTNEFYQDVGAHYEARATEIKATFASENISKIVSSVGGVGEAIKFDADTFLAEVRASANRKTGKFDVDAFLEEMRK